MSRPWLLWLPLAGFVAVATLFVLGLRRPDDPSVASRLIGVAVPAFALPAALAGTPGLASGDLADGHAHLVNVFASWCVPCAAEAPQLGGLRAAGVDIVGIAIRDRPDALAGFVARYGNPFARVGIDPDSRVQIALGSSGVPESFVVDGRGIVRYQKIGPIMPQDAAAVRAAVAAAR